MHKAGYVNIVGLPNVGKSTLMNKLIGEKLSIVTPKAQTTRHRILGILNEEDYQIVFSDTPGILKPAYKMQEMMMDFVKMAYVDADILVYITTVDDIPTDGSIPPEVLRSKVPVIHLINKADLSQQEKLLALLEQWKNFLPDADHIIISALHGFNVDVLKQRIVDTLPEHPPYFDKEDISDRNMRFFIAEMVREKIYEIYRQEIPYSTDVLVDEYKEKEKITAIKATIYVNKESQKGILIGQKGLALKKLGVESRKVIEDWLGVHVFLELQVKVLKNWRDNQNILKKLGYK